MPEEFIKDIPTFKNFNTQFSKEVPFCNAKKYKRSIPTIIIANHSLRHLTHFMPLVSFCAT